MKEVALVKNHVETARLLHSLFLEFVNQKKSPRALDKVEPHEGKKEENQE